ncbi:MULTISPECIES: hypothetical protein [Sorangium]|uniref:hypothetical protein n=1 Tax=Sorangium TaxID=39643 RepID=UPI003D9C1953
MDPVANVALVRAVVPFVRGYRETSTSSISHNGQEVASSRRSIDHVALPVGALVAALGLTALLRGLEAPAAARAARLAAAVSWPRTLALARWSQRAGARPRRCWPRRAYTGRICCNA